MLFIDAVAPDEGEALVDVRWVRPSMITRMSDELYAVEDEDPRREYYSAAMSSRKKVEQLEERLSLLVHRWYADNSREGVRDETFSLWMEHGAMRRRPGVPTTASTPRWAMTNSFADLFAPDLAGDELDDAIDSWRDDHMDPTVLARLVFLRQRDESQHEVRVELPRGRVRVLAPGESSLILKGVIEEWAPRRLADPEVITVSEPGQKLLVADRAALRALGITLDPGNLLPDAMIVDIGVKPSVFWVIEAVASDGPIDEPRRRKLLEWAAEQRIPAAQCRFLTAFSDRDDPPVKRRLKDLAVGTFAWFASEPTRELAWYDIAGPD